ncbi:MAG: protein kinase, partial [Vicinamibacterales bacterium]
GEVYRARDPRLGRDVAIKVLPAEAACDAERLHRFELEARATAALNHPNILNLLDIGTHNGEPFLVSELLEGRTLRDVLRAGPLSIRQALEYGVQIVRGLAAAHEKGITHRDLKPENIFVTADGRVKILDFGLAKLRASTQPVSESPSGEIDQQSTRTTPAGGTGPGLVIGTIGYMAPEQVRGQEVDHRADIFAFGAVLYEMVCGERAFSGATPADTMTAILTFDPPDVLSPSVPSGSALSRIVRRCLEKPPSARFQTAADLGFALESAQIASGVQAVSGVERSVDRTDRAWKTRAAWSALGATAAVVVGVAGWRLMSGPAVADPVPAIRLRVQPPVGSQLSLSGAAFPPMAVSPDGSTLAFALSNNKLGLKRLASADSVAIDNVSYVAWPFWANDGHAVAVLDNGNGNLKVIDTISGSAEVITANAGLADGGSWSGDTIIFGPGANGGLYRVSVRGGVPEPLTTPDSTKGEQAHKHPWFLPDGRHFLFWVSPSKRIVVGSLDHPEQRVDVTPSDSRAAYARGRLLFVRNGTLFAQPFDASTLRLSGDAQVVANNVGFNALNGRAVFAASDRSIAFLENPVVGPLLWRGRNGAQLGEAAPPSNYHGFSLSPDGSRIVASRATDANGADLWLTATASNIHDRWTFQNAAELTVPEWSGDGSQIAFFNARTRDVIVRTVGNGTTHSLARVPRDGAPGANVDLDWSPDAQTILASLSTATNGYDIWRLPTNGGPPQRLLGGGFSERAPRISPDGGWLAYMSNETGQFEVYLAPLNNLAARQAISTGGGLFPMWNGTKELFYMSADGWITAVPLRLRDGAAVAEVPVRLFRMGPQARSSYPDYRPTLGGERFLVRASDGTSGAGIMFVYNWTADLNPTSPPVK